MINSRPRLAASIGRLLLLSVVFGGCDACESKPGRNFGGATLTGGAGGGPGTGGAGGGPGTGGRGGAPGTGGGPSGTGGVNTEVAAEVMEAGIEVPVDAAVCPVALQRRCNGDLLETCSNDRTMLMTKPCQTGCDPQTLDCRPCAPLGKTCSTPTELRSCDASGVTLTNCSKGCNAGRLECNLCEPNKLACAGGLLRRCDAAGASETVTACPNGTCATDGTSCATCEIGKSYCNGVARYDCPAGTGVKVEDCANGCFEGRCGICTPGAKRCSADGAVETCNATGSAFTVTACPYGCANNDCRTCMPGSKVCRNDGIEECRQDGSGTFLTPCQYGCLNGACRACMPGAIECRGDELWTCNGSWQRSETCAAGCSATRRVCNVCRPNQRDCSGRTLRTCNGEGSGYAAQVTCGDPQPDTGDTLPRGTGTCEVATSGPRCAVSCQPENDYLRCPVPANPVPFVCRIKDKPGHCNCFKCPGWSNLCPTALCGTIHVDPDDGQRYQVTCDILRGRLGIVHVDAEDKPDNGAVSDEIRAELTAEYPCVQEDPS